MGALRGGLRTPAPWDILTLNCADIMSIYMKSVDALRLRQSLGRILRALARGGRPILVERRGRPAAALISIDDYRERFVDREADERRREVVARIKRLRFESHPRRTTLDLLRQLRAGS